MGATVVAVRTTVTTEVTEEAGEGVATREGMALPVVEVVAGGVTTGTTRTEVGGVEGPLEVEDAVAITVQGVEGGGVGEEGGVIMAVEGGNQRLDGHKAGT